MIGGTRSVPHQAFAGTNGLIRLRLGGIGHACSRTCGSPSYMFWNKTKKCHAAAGETDVHRVKRPVEISTTYLLTMMFYKTCASRASWNYGLPWICEPPSTNLRGRSMCCIQTDPSSTEEKGYSYVFVLGNTLLLFCL